MRSLALTTMISVFANPGPSPPPFHTVHVTRRGTYDEYYPSQSYSSRRHSPGQQPSSRQAPTHGARGNRDRDRDAPRGHMRSRREMDSRDHYARTDREPKRRRSDPMGDNDVNGHRPTRDDRGSRCAVCVKAGSLVCM